ncbi:sigma-70 family RNA polymerase sigma factor [Acinetobacter sp. I-MWF]|uniref:sigma-70 family RNA polymerase sigma factor n=1 Tax=Acinetobacter sp. I-MWF TaxID=2940517 RepID=UPI0021C879DD|nr:sigma-70 family RNA polymerase sigma factor [Acinetobacter sp. I-MWF]MCT9979085.1 sigma-70 family RNA polymerase sigma factor [Acinetobacter sp. I-MWF]
MIPILPTPSRQQILQEMYLDHHDWLKQWLNSRVRYPFTAADLVQDTFVKLLQTKQLFSIQEPRAYLVNVAKHLLIDKHRRYILEQNYLETLKQYADDQDLLVTSNQIEEAVLILDFLTIALQDTTALTRKAFIMYYFEGYSQSEIATEIGKSLRTTQLYLAECLQLCYEAKNNLLELGLDER